MNQGGSNVPGPQARELSEDFRGGSTASKVVEDDRHWDAGARKTSGTVQHERIGGNVVPPVHGLHFLLSSQLWQIIPSA
jgi:hypothetical protein